MNGIQLTGVSRYRIVDDFAVQVIIRNYGEWHCSAYVLEFDDQEHGSVLGG